MDYYKKDNRFVPLSQRENNSDMLNTIRVGGSAEAAIQLYHAIQMSKWSPDGTPKIHWKGVRLLKDPWDFAIVPMLLWELKPKTILELGTYEGGAAIWMVDLLKNMDPNLDTKVYTWEYDASLVKIDHPDVKVIIADLNQDPKKLFNEEWLKSLPHPWLVCDDAHVNTPAILSHFHPFIEEGDYVVMEDTHGMQPGKYKLLEDFCTQYPEYYVDTFYCDYFAHNFTWNWNGYLKKTKKVVEEPPKTEEDVSSPVPE